MPLRVVVLAEGALELGPTSPRPAPSQSLHTEELGPAHILVARVLQAEGHEDLVFEEPLRGRRGRIAVGSDLLTRPTLRRLLTWVDPRKQPDLAVLLVDRNGDRHRLASIQHMTEGLMVFLAIGVAVPEFETWLIADEQAVSKAVGSPFQCKQQPESHQPGESKRSLREAISSSSQGSESFIRRKIAAECDLDQLRQRCRSFEKFQASLRAATS